jgi:hypothetical protein
VLGSLRLPAPTPLPLMPAPTSSLNRLASPVQAAKYNPSSLGPLASLTLVSRRCPIHSFRPNPAAPYNPTGAPQLLRPQQLLGGSSLQQSFQQLNQDVKGTTTPRVPRTLSKAEKKSYDQIFRAWDTSGPGFIDGKTAIEVFGQSGIDRNDHARIR